MATPVKMPRLSKFTETSEVVEWFKVPGETVLEGEPLLVVSSDKATVEISAPTGGVLLQTAVAAGSEVQAGSVLALIGQLGEELETGEPAAAEPEAWPSPGARGKAQLDDRPRPRVEGQIKAVPAARRLANQHNLSLKRLSGTGPGQIITRADVERAIADEVRARQEKSHHISPVARRMAEGHGLDPNRIEGTGPGSRITKADVQRLLDEGLPAGAGADPPDSTESESGRRILPLGDLRRAMAQRMTTSHQTIVQATTVADVDMTEVVRMRRRIPASFTAFVVKAAARSVAEFPLINATLERDTIVLNQHVHMGVAVSRDDGLLVPVIRHAESKSLAEIHWEIEALSERARSRTLTLEEMRDPTLTVTNSGALGSLLFTPIVVAPQAATLGMGKVAPTPVVRDGQIAIREIMYLCLSYDHRFVDGALAVRYLQQVRTLLEDPMTLLWDSGT
jgi:pyruvate/2-oxoglutarate dehydrogenase complex dihydrolipoamide acyltransferase (E2) component